MGHETHSISYTCLTNTEMLLNSVSFFASVADHNCFLFQDIRRYFSAVGGTKKSGSSHSSKEVKKRNVINDSDDDDMPVVVSSIKRPRIVESDSGVKEDVLANHCIFVSLFCR